MSEENKYPRFSFGGAIAIEWFSGLVIFFLISLLDEDDAKIMPFMLIAWIITTFGMAFFRIKFVEKKTFKEALAEERKSSILFNEIQQKRRKKMSKLEKILAWIACIILTLMCIFF